MKRNLLIIFFVLSVLGNGILLHLYNQKSAVADNGLNILYYAFDRGMGADVHLINAMNGHGKEHLLQAYADLHLASESLAYLKPQIGIVSDKDVISFYSSLLLEWLAEDYAPTEEDYQNLISDVELIYHTFSNWEETPGKLKERSIFDWDDDEYEENIEKLKADLVLFNE